MMRDARGRWTSEGRRLLLAHLATRTAVEVAGDCKCTPAAISLLANGKTRVPTLDIARELLRLGINMLTWLDPPAVQSAMAMTNVSPLTPLGVIFTEGGTVAAEGNANGLSQHPDESAADRRDLSRSSHPR